MASSLSSSSLVATGAPLEGDANAEASEKLSIAINGFGFALPGIA